MTHAPTPLPSTPHGQYVCECCCFWYLRKRSQSQIQDGPVFWGRKVAWPGMPTVLLTNLQQQCSITLMLIVSEWDVRQSHAGCNIKVSTYFWSRLRCKALSVSHRGFLSKTLQKALNLNSWILSFALLSPSPSLSISLSLSLWSSLSPSLHRGMPLINSKTRLGRPSD